MLPPIVISLMAPFRSFFTAPVWEHVLALVTGMVLAPGKRTVSAALRIMGLGGTRDFALYHYVLNRARWNSRAIARPLLTMILDRFLPVGPVVIPTRADQNRYAQSRSPMDMMRQGCSTSLFHASQQWSTMSS